MQNINVIIIIIIIIIIIKREVALRPKTARS